MLGHPWIGNYLLQLYLALVLLDAGGLEADQLAWWRLGSIPPPPPSPTPRQAMSGIAAPANHRKDVHAIPADDKVQMFSTSWTGQPHIQLPSIKNMQKRDLTNNSSSRLAELVHFPVNNAQTKVTNTENLTQSLDQYKMCLHSQAGGPVDGCSARAEPVARQICVHTPRSTRVNKLLFHPSFPSRCWTPGGASCPPPVLRNATLAALLSEDDSEECVQTAVQVLCEIVRVNARIERAEQVMSSGFCTGAPTDNIKSGGGSRPGGGGDQACDEGDSSTYTRCKNCRECKKWVLSWMCMVAWPLVLGEVEINPCPELCSLVQEHCPFNIILEDSSTAAGDPTFLCQDPVIIGGGGGGGWTSRPNCCSLPVSVSPDAAAGSTAAEVGRVLDPPAGGWRDLNATQCSALLNTTPPHAAAAPYCDNGYSSLRLANRTLSLRGLEVVDRGGHWFWDLVTISSGGSAPPSRSGLVLGLCVVLSCVTAVNPPS